MTYHAPGNVGPIPSGQFSLVLSLPLSAQEYCPLCLEHFISVARCPQAWTMPSSSPFYVYPHIVSDIPMDSQEVHAGLLRAV